ncbi:hypothetical protein [Microbacterium sp. PMB16]|uniref:hypothetical protein n=1 Tax=Microbacterium sp. PMB16 TaxID=3120157 RepID=UPI003F4B2D81
MEHNTVVVAAARWDDVSSLVGREFVSDWLQVDDEHIVQFERGSYLTENSQAMSLDAYPDGLVEGFHLLSLLDYLTNGVSYVDDPAWMGWNYGLNRVRFVSPVTIHDRLRARGAISSMTPRGDGQLVTYELRLEVDGREKPALTAEWLVLWGLESGSD